MLMIRAGKESDSEYVLDILMTCFKEEMSHMFRGRLALAREVFGAYYHSDVGNQYLKNSLIAESGGKVVGTLGLHYPGGETRKASNYPLFSLIRKTNLFSGIFIKRAIWTYEYTEDYKDCVYLDVLGVLPNYRSKGIATALYKKIEKDAKKKGMKRIAFDVWASNKKAIRLYEKLGYTITGKVSSRAAKFFLGENNYVIMEKTR